MTLTIDRHRLHHYQIFGKHNENETTHIDSRSNVYSVGVDEPRPSEDSLYPYLASIHSKLESHDYSQLDHSVVHTFPKSRSSGFYRNVQGDDINFARLLAIGAHVNFIRA